MLGYLANEIGRKIRVGMGNFIVVPPAIVTVLQTAAKSVFAPATEGSFKGPNNSMLVGTLNGTIKVYSYLWNSAQSTSVGGTGDMSILMGYKGGNGETEAGYFYCPYIPVQSSGVIVNPVTYQPVVSLMTRYGKTAFVNSNTSLGNSADYYAKLNVTDLSFA
ncbi:Major capsid protein Gp23 [compost metagenome]